jgi:hypothetical protein
MNSARHINKLWAVIAGLSLLAIQGGNWASVTTSAGTTPAGTISLSQTGTANRTQAAPTQRLPGRQATPASAKPTNPRTPTSSVPTVKPADAAPAQPTAAVAATNTEAKAPQTEDCGGKCDELNRLRNENRGLLNMIHDLSAAKPPTLTTQTDDKKTDKSDEEKQKNKCEDEKDSLKELECLVKAVDVTTPKDEDKEAFIDFMFGGGNVEECIEGEPSSFPNSGFKQALQIDSKKALRAFQKGMRKIKDRKRDYSCHGLNIAKQIESERVQRSLEVRLRSIDRQINQQQLIVSQSNDPSARLRLEELRMQRMQVANAYATVGPNGRLYGPVAEFDSIFRTTALDVYRGLDDVYSADYGGRGPMGEIYSWLDDVRAGRNPNWYDTGVVIADGRGGTTVVSGPQANWYRVRQAGGQRAQGYPGQLSGTTPRFGTPAFLPGTSTIPNMSVINNQNTSMPPSMVGGRPNLILN